MASLRSLLIAPVAVAAASLVVASPAGAHTGHPASGAADGFLHPITGLDHLLAMVAVGVVAAVALRGRQVWLAPVAFVGGMALGGLGGIVGVSLPGAETMILASVFLLGLAIALAVEAPARMQGVLVAVLAFAGLAHGHAHGAEAPEAANLVAYVAGFLAATAGLHVIGVGVGTVIRDRRTMRFGLGLTTVTAGALLLV